MNKILFILVLLFLSGCYSESNQEELAGLKNTYYHLDKNNKRGLLRMRKEADDNGNRKFETDVVERYSELLNSRDSILSNDSTFINYYKLITSFYPKTNDYFDSLKLRDASMLFKKWEKHSDSTVFYSCLLNLLLIESDIMKFYGSRLEGSCGFGHFAEVSKDRDTINLNEEYSFAVSPVETFYRTALIQPDTILEVKNNDVVENIPYVIEKAGGVLIVKVKPKKKGNYIIKGHLTIHKKGEKFKFPYEFIDKFYVM